jgi:hypothetical protein
MHPIPLQVLLQLLLPLLLQNSEGTPQATAALQLPAACLQTFA